MAPVQLQYVVSFTSQDDVHKANNLLSMDRQKKWLSHPKDRSGKIEIIFQLEEPCRFSYIDVGTLWCASLEVRVGRSDWPLTQEYKILVPAVNLMSPIDCQLGRKTTSTNMFSKGNFSTDTASQPWDRLQIICRQPYRKDAQLGISFVHIRNSETSAKSGPENNHLDSSKRSPLSSVSRIQKHFFGEAKKSEDDYTDNLKYRLLQMTNSTDNGSDVVHEQALTRTAQLVLKATEVTQNSSKHYKLLAKQTRRGLFSGSVVSKEHVKINKEIASFLSNLNIQLCQLDSITIADLRHKFERLLKRKLTVEEKRIFSAECQSFICSLVEGTSGASENEKHTSCEKSSKNPLHPRLPVPSPNTPSKTVSSFKKDFSLSSSNNSPQLIRETKIVSSSSPQARPSTKVKLLANSSSPAPMTIHPCVASQSIKRNVGVSDHHRLNNGQMEKVLKGDNSKQESKPLAGQCMRNKQNTASVRQRHRNMKALADADWNSSDRGNKKKGRTEEKGDRVDKKKRNEHHDLSSDDDDDVISDSSVTYDEDNENDDVISDSDKNCSLNKSPRLERGRTINEINKAYADLYKSDLLAAGQSESLANRKSDKKRKNLSQNSLDLIQSFQSELSDDDNDNSTTSAPSTSLFSPWLNVKKNNNNVSKNNNNSDNKTPMKRNGKSSSQKERQVSSLASPSRPPKSTKRFFHGNSSQKKTSGSVNADVVVQESPSGNLCSPSTQLFSKSNAGMGSLTSQNRTSQAVTRKETEASMLICPSCDVLIPAEIYQAHIAACMDLSEGNGTSANEATIDMDEEFGECPICLQRFHLDVLQTHASECGL